MTISQADAAQGLTSADAAARLASAGPNEIARSNGTPWWRMLATQFESALVLLLAAACLLSAAVGEVVDAAAIGAIVVMNGLIGFWQERSAEHAVLALRAMTAPRARVVRDDQVAEVPARDVVPGDLLVLEEGDIVAADAHVLRRLPLEYQAATQSKFFYIARQLSAWPRWPSSK